MTMKKTKNCFVTAMLAASVAMMCMTSCAKEDNPIDAEMEGVTGGTLSAIVVGGTVLDQMGEPMIGAVVTVKGSPVYSVTDVNGNFSIPANDNAILVVSYVGYSTEEVSVNGGSGKTIVLKENEIIEGGIVVVH
jgi:hypothetical protein